MFACPLPPFIMTDPCSLSNRGRATTTDEKMEREKTIKDGKRRTKKRKEKKIIIMTKDILTLKNGFISNNKRNKSYIQ
jgi:hypothetical protein